VLTSEGNIHVRKFAKFRQGSTLSKKSVVKVPRLQGDKNFDSMTPEQLKGRVTHRKVTSLAALDKNFDSMTPEQLKGRMTHRRVTTLAAVDVAET